MVFPEGVTFSLEVGPDVRRDRPPDTRRRAAEDRLAELPSEATWIWSDGSASGGVMDGGGGATIPFPSGDTQEVRVAAGSLCSNTRAELFALRAALEEPSRAETRADSLPVVVCTDSMAALARLRIGPAAQRAPVVAAIWELLQPLADRGQPVFKQCATSVRTPSPGKPATPAARDPNRHRDRPEGRCEVCYRCVAEELA